MIVDHTGQADTGISTCCKKTKMRDLIRGFAFILMICHNYNKLYDLLVP